jgi:hypothetical protein
MHSSIADKREFLRISQAVGMGFLIMGVIGYIVKLSKFLEFYCSVPLSIPDSRQGGLATKSKRTERRAGMKHARRSLIPFGSAS